MIQEYSSVNKIFDFAWLCEQNVFFEKKHFSLPDLFLLTQHAIFEVIEELSLSLLIKNEGTTSTLQQWYSLNDSYSLYENMFFPAMDSHGYSSYPRACTLK